MITDINKTRELLIKHKKENTKFYSFLKASKKLHKTFSRFTEDFYNETLSKINCSDCANCCKEISPIIKNTDIDRISKYLKIKPSYFIDTYLHRDNDDDLIFNSTPCPFLKNNLCSIYEIRPNDCKSYPHISKKQLTSNLSYHIKNCNYCPITFEVFEKLKMKFLESKISLTNNLKNIKQ